MCLSPSAPAARLARLCQLHALPVPNSLSLPQENFEEEKENTKQNKQDEFLQPPHGSPLAEMLTGLQQALPADLP